MSNRNNDDPLQPPVITTDGSTTPSPVAMRARNNIFPSPQPSYGNISYMKQRAYRANTGTGAPAYSNIHHKRYPSTKGSNQNQTKHQPSASSSKHQINHSGKNISPLVNGSSSSVLGSSVPSPSSMKINSPNDIIHMRERSFSSNSNYSITSNNSPRPHNLSAESNIPPHALLTPKQEHDSGSNKSSPLKFSDLDADMYSPHNRNKPNNVPLFTNSPSPQRKLYDSPSIYGMKAEKSEPKKSIMKGLALQIPGVSGDQPSSFASNNLRRGMPLNSSPGSSLKQAVIPEISHSEHSFKRESNSSSEDELFNDVVEDEDDEDEDDLNSEPLASKTLEDKLDHSSLSSMAQTLDSRSPLRSGNLTENDSTRIINNDDDTPVAQKYKEKYTKQDSKEFDDSFYKVQNKQSQGFLSPTFDDDNTKLEHTSGIGLISSVDTRFSPMSTEVISPIDAPETPINKIPASKADAELQNAIKSLLSIKRTPTGVIPKSSTSLLAKSFPDKIEEASSENEQSNKDVQDSLISQKKKPHEDTSGSESTNALADINKLANLAHNGKSDLYLDRFPSFSLSSDLISPPKSPAEPKSSSIHDQLINNIKGASKRMSGSDRNKIADISYTSLQDDDNTSVTSKKSYFDIMKNSLSSINWDVKDPSAWTMDRVVLWLKMYEFNETWIDIFVKYKMCHDKFLELINDESFSKFNTYLKLNNDYLDVATSDKDSKKDDGESNKNTNINNGSENSEVDGNNKFLSSSSKFRYLLKKTIQNDPEKISLPSNGRVMDDLDIISKSRPNLMHRHSRSSSDDASNVLSRIMNKDKSYKGGFNLLDGGNVINHTVANPPISSPSIISPELPQSKANKRLSYIKKPFMSIDKSKNANNSDSSPSSPYSSIFKKHVNSLSPSSRLTFDENDNESIDNIENKDKRASTFLKKKLRKMDKLTLSTSAGRKSIEGSSPISPGTISSFESNKKGLVGHLQLTDNQVPKPFNKKSKNYILVTKDNISFVPVGAQNLSNINSFKLSIASSLQLQTEDLKKLHFHLTDYESEYGEALSDSTLEDLISFDFINYELKFYVYSEIPSSSELTYSQTVSTRSTKSSDNNSFELAADNKIAYPNTPSYLISDNKNPSEEVDYLNFKDNKGFLAVEKELPQKRFVSQQSSFSVIRPDANKHEINFDKKRESPFATVKPNLIPQRPAPSAPSASVQKTASITRKSNVKSGDNNKNSIMLSASELKRTNSLLRNSVARQRSIRKSTRFSGRNSVESFKENEISFDGVPTLTEENSEEEDDSDDDFWAVAPKTTTTPSAAEAEDSWKDSDAPGSVTGTPEQVMKTSPERPNGTQRLPAINTTELTSEKRKRNFSSPVFGTSFKGKGGKGNWEFRPSDVTLIDNLEHFFPNTDLDKPIIYEVDTPPASPDVLPPISDDMFNIPVAKEITGEDILMFKDSDRRISRNSRRKTIRGIARESSIARSRLSQVAQATNNNALLRRRSTKFWGRKTVELTPTDLKYDRISELRNNKGETKQIKWIKGDLIGTGSYGRVYLAINLINGEMMAVKQVVKPRSGKVNEDMQNVINALLEEMQFMKDLDHPNITQYLGFEDVGDTYSLFLEYVAGGSVASCLSNYGRFDDKLIRYLTRQITDGLAYLHSEGILHRDLKAANLLLDLDGICKISDFGISKRSSNVYKNDAAMSMQGTIFWMAPEVVNNSEDSGYSAKVDIWSLGCVVLEMFAGKRPWSNFEFVTALMKIGTYAAPPIDNETKKYISDDGNEFLNECFKVKPVERPTALELFENNEFCKPMPDFNFRDTELSKMMLRKS